MNNMYITDLSSFLPGLTTAYTYSCIEPGDKDPETNKTLKPESYMIEFNGHRWFTDTECVNAITSDYINLDIKFITMPELLEHIKQYESNYNDFKKLNDTLEEIPFIILKYSWEYIENPNEGKQISHATDILYKFEDYIMIFDCFLPNSLHFFNYKTLEHLDIYVDSDIEKEMMKINIDLSELSKAFMDINNEEI